MKCEHPAWAVGAALRPWLVPVPWAHPLITLRPCFQVLRPIQALPHTYTRLSHAKSEAHSVFLLPQPWVALIQWSCSLWWGSCGVCSDQPALRDAWGKGTVSLPTTNCVKSITVSCWKDQYSEPDALPQEISGIQGLYSFFWELSWSLMKTVKGIKCYLKSGYCAHVGTKCIFSNSMVLFLSSSKSSQLSFSSPFQQLSLKDLKYIWILTPVCTALFPCLQQASSPHTFLFSFPSLLWLLLK